MSTSVPIRWSRALSTLLAGLLAVAAVTAAGYAAAAVLSQATDSSGSVCGSAWRFHSGSGALVSGAELTWQQRARASQECARSGDADWQRGVRLGRFAAGAAAAAIAFALWSRFGPAFPGPSRHRPSGPRPPRHRPSDRPVRAAGSARAGRRSP
jgi:hypothetical protein